MKSGHRLHIILGVLVIGLLAAVSIPVQAALTGGGYWTSIPDHGAGRVNQSLVWTGSKMIYWGGMWTGIPLLASGGESYDPVADAWTPITTTNALDGRIGALALWTGREVILWGGGNGLLTYNDGKRYDPAADTWVSMTITHAPPARAYTPVFWTGSEMIFYGGMHAVYEYLDDGARYNPQTDTWTALNPNGTPGLRSGSSVVWTGTQLIAWGGRTENGSSTPGDFLNDGARYTLESDTWAPITTTLAPSPRANHAAVWTGKVMIVWGGEDSSGRLSDGGIYDPATDTWTALPSSLPGAPAARKSAFAAWTGRQMVIYGGSDGPTELKDGGIYDPHTNTWQVLSTVNAPADVNAPSIVWTGHRMMLWGNKYVSFRVYTGGGAIWTLPVSTYLPVIQK